MNNSSINSILEAVKMPESFFKTFNQFELEDSDGDDLMFFPSNFSVTFKVISNGVKYALKCYNSSNVTRKLHFDGLRSFFDENKRDYFVDFTFYESEVALYGEDSNVQHFDVLVTPWIEGQTLHDVICDAAHLGDKDKIASLRNLFIDLVTDFVALGFAHGDLKPQNIIFDKYSKDLKVIDYDASWIESNDSLKNTEIGTYWYQHPYRKDYMWGKNIDNYSIVLIIVSLLALETNLHLFEKYNNGENIIFSPADIVEGKCFAYSEMRERWRGNNRLSAFLDSLSSVMPYSYSIADFIKEINSKICYDEVIRDENIIDMDCNYRRYYDNYGLWGYVDRNSKVKMFAQWDTISEFVDGYSVVRGDMLSYFVTEECVLINVAFQYIEQYDKDFAVVVSEGKYGIIDMIDYNYVLQPTYQFISLFCCGMIIVKKSDVYYIVDELFNRISSNNYNYCKVNNHGYAVVGDGVEYWVVDHTDTVISERSADKLIYVKKEYFRKMNDNQLIKVTLISN